ncbi:MAG: hypothetical protein NVSMB24_15200 [Mucilaginibacter sp.]
MKKKIHLITTTLLLTVTALFLSSCLKDSRFVDFSKVGTLVEFPLGGLANFSNDAVTDATDTITKQFAIDVASPSVPTTATAVTLSVNDPAVIAAYMATNSKVNYLPMPAGSYVFNTTSVTIPAGKRVAILSVTFYKHALDPSKSYMFPIKIVSAGGYNIPSNLNTLFYHFIGNPFAGSYTHNFSRYNGYTSPPPPGTPVSGGSFTGHTEIASPVTPTQFEIAGGYYTGTIRYEVSFTQPDPTHFQDFQISINSDDIANILVANSISLVQQPVFGFGTAYAPGTPYTYAQALTFFTFQYTVATSAPRYLVDQYIHN